MSNDNDIYPYILKYSLPFFIPFRYFAMFFLNGDIFPALIKYQKKLRSSPKNVIKSWARNTPHILGFVNSLLRHKIHSKQQILDVWAKDKFCKYSLSLFYLENNTHDIFYQIYLENNITKNRFFLLQIFYKNIVIFFSNRSRRPLSNGHHWSNYFKI